MEVKPYQDPTKEYTQVHNILFDVIMPDLKHTSFKVLCLIFRKTYGWHKSVDDISFSQIKTGTGIKSNHTVISALEELTAKGHIVIISHEGQWQSNSYAINIDFTMTLPEDEPPGAKNAPEENNRSSAKNAPGPGAENALEPSAKNAPTKDTVKNKVKNKEAAKKAAAPPPPAKPAKKKPVTKKKPAKKPVPPAVEAYREQFKRYPNKSVWPDIEREIGAEEGSLIKWRQTLEAWRLSGNKNPYNFVGLFDWFRNGIPEYAQHKNGGGQNGSARRSTNSRDKKYGGNQLWPMPQERVVPSQLVKRVPVAEAATSSGD
jgi:hypothetical protein